MVEAWLCVYWSHVLSAAFQFFSVLTDEVSLKAVLFPEVSFHTGLCRMNVLKRVNGVVVWRWSARCCSLWPSFGCCFTKDDFGCSSFSWGFCLYFLIIIIMWQFLCSSSLPNVVWYVFPNHGDRQAAPKINKHQLKLSTLERQLYLAQKNDIFGGSVIYCCNNVYLFIYFLGGAINLI